MATTTKERILDTTAELFRRYGYTGTGLKQIVAEAQAPFGSIYHHFPGGKEQLGREVIVRSGGMYQELVETIIDGAPDIVTRCKECLRGRGGAVAPDGLRRRLPDCHRGAGSRQHQRDAAAGHR